MIDNFLILGTVFVFINEYQKLFRMNEKMDLTLIAGTISTTVFTLSNIPMLLKAIRTRSLRSYSYTYIVMNNIANLIHWFYILALPFGPIWLLHGFYSLSSMLMLFWYIRFEKDYKLIFSK